MALTTLRENKLRSFLTVLGVVIGITALLSVVSILVGVYGDVNAYLLDYGTETLFIFRFDPGIHTGRLTPEERARKPLSLEDAEAAHRHSPSRAVTQDSIARASASSSESGLRARSSGVSLPVWMPGSKRKMKRVSFRNPINKHSRPRRHPRGWRRRKEER